MADKIIVSNIRMPENEWLQMKSTAQSKGMSVNEYINYLGRTDALKSITGRRPVKRMKKTGYDALEELRGLISKSKGKPMGASEEDKIIYGIED